MLKWPLRWRIGITTSSGPRTASETSIVRFAPSRTISEPAGIPTTTTGSSSAARTQLILAVEPVVWSTNQGKAMNVIAEPVSDASSAATIPTRERSRSIAK